MLCPLVYKANLTIYGLEYPTYGLYKKCESSLISEGIKYDSLLFYDFLIHNNRSNKDIAVIGRSIGSGPATYLAGHRPLSALILISPFDNVKNWTKKY
jgi:esterase/lipase